jgi:hypothetical protein
MMSGPFLANNVRLLFISSEPVAELGRLCSRFDRQSSPSQLVAGTCPSNSDVPNWMVALLVWGMMPEKLNHGRFRKVDRRLSDTESGKSGTVRNAIREIETRAEKVLQVSHAHYVRALRKSFFECLGYSGCHSLLLPFLDLLSS